VSTSVLRRILSGRALTCFLRTTSFRIQRLSGTKGFADSKRPSRRSGFHEGGQLTRTLAHENQHPLMADEAGWSSGSPAQETGTCASAAAGFVMACRDTPRP